MKEITPEFFKRFGGLAVLDMRGNRVVSLEDYVFSNLQSLTHLGLEQNMISSIAAHSFHGLLHLRYLNLKSNRITTINLGDIPTGADVSLQYNSIKSISKITGLPTSTHSMYNLQVFKERQVTIGKMMF